MGLLGVVGLTSSRLIPMRVGGTVIELEADALGRAQEAIIEVARPVTVGAP
jgi:hypothetical protein